MTVGGTLEGKDERFPIPFNNYALWEEILIVSIRGLPDAEPDVKRHQDKESAGL